MQKLTVIFLVLAAMLSASAFAADHNNNVKQVAILDLPGRPGFDQMVFAKGMLIIAHPSAGTVEIYDPFRRRVVGAVKDMSSPRGVSLSNDGAFVYIANHDANNVVVLDTEDWKVQRTIPVNGAPSAVIPVPNSHLLLVTLPEDSQVAAVDLGKGEQISQVDVGGRPEQLAFDTNRNIAYATVQDRKEIVAISPSMQISKHITLNGSLPTGIIFDKEQDRLYVSVRYAVLTIDPQSGQEVGRVPASGGVDTLWLDATSQNVFAAGGGSLFIMKAGSKLGEPVEVPVDVKGHTVAYDPTKNFIYVPGGREGRAKLLILKEVTPGQPQLTPQQAVNGGAPIPSSGVKTAGK